VKSVLTIKKYRRANWIMIEMFCFLRVVTFCLISILKFMIVKMEVRDQKVEIEEYLSEIKEGSKYFVRGKPLVQY